jgi:hypothetical protein
MTHAESKTKGGWRYETEDVFGKLTVESAERLDGSTLDSLVGLMLKTTKAATTSGEVNLPQGGTVNFNFVRAPSWDEEAENLNH